MRWTLTGNSIPSNGVKILLSNNHHNYFTSRLAKRVRHVTSLYRQEPSQLIQKFIASFYIYWWKMSCVPWLGYRKFRMKDVCLAKEIPISRVFRTIPLMNPIIGICEITNEGFPSLWTPKICSCNCTDSSTIIKEI